MGLKSRGGGGLKERVKDTGWMGMKMGEKKSGREPHRRVWEKTPSQMITTAVKHRNITSTKEKSYEGNYLSRRFWNTFVSVDKSNIKAVATYL